MTNKNVTRLPSFKLPKSDNKRNAVQGFEDIPAAYSIGMSFGTTRSSSEEAVNSVLQVPTTEPKMNFC